MKLLTAAKMKIIEQAAISSGVVTGLELMERAGQGVVKKIFEWKPELAEGAHRAVVMCGPGNNGGDGYVVARILQERGWWVEVLASGPPQTDDAKEMAKKWGGVSQALDVDTFARQAHADLYIDAIFGAGLSRPSEGDIRHLFAHIAYGPYFGYVYPRMVAIDGPTGLCLDSGRPLSGGGYPDQFGEPSEANRAALTVTFQRPKIGHLIGEGPIHCGDLKVVDIGLDKWMKANLPEGNPESYRNSRDVPNTWVYSQNTFGLPPFNEDDPECWRPPHVGKRPMYKNFNSVCPTHKYAWGHTVVFSGGVGRSGAARLAARAALREGAGLVTVAAPQDAMPECAAHLTAVMLRAVNTPQEVAKLLKDQRITSVCIGPGLGLDQAAEDRLKAVLECCHPLSSQHKNGRPLVLDADAISLIAVSEDLRALLHQNCVLTPHMGEFKRLCPDLAERLVYQKGGLAGPAFSKVDAAREAAQRLGAVILLKGSDTVIASPVRDTFVHSAAYGREAPWLATAGSGDVLAGFIAGRMARHGSPEIAAIVATWLHVECARAFGPGLIAEDLPEMVPKVLSTL